MKKSATVPPDNKFRENVDELLQEIKLLEVITETNAIHELLQKQVHAHIRQYEPLQKKLI